MVDEVTVTMWRTSNGALHETREEAEAHEERDNLVDVLMHLAALSGVVGSPADWKDYAEGLTTLCPKAAVLISAVPRPITKI